MGKTSGWGVRRDQPEQSGHNLLEKPEAVLLLFDAKNRRMMAVKPSNKGDSRAYPLNKHRKNDASIPATKFLEHYGPARRFTTMPSSTATCW